MSERPRGRGAKYFALAAVTLLFMSAVILFLPALAAPAPSAESGSSGVSPAATCSTGINTGVKSVAGVTTQTQTGFSVCAGGDILTGLAENYISGTAAMSCTDSLSNAFKLISQTNITDYSFAIFGFYYTTAESGLSITCTASSASYLGMNTFTFNGTTALDLSVGTASVSPAASIYAIASMAKISAGNFWLLGFPFSGSTSTSNVQSGFYNATLNGANLTTSTVVGFGTGGAFIDGPFYYYSSPLLNTAYSFGAEAKDSFTATTSSGTTVGVMVAIPVQGVSLPPAPTNLTVSSVTQKTAVASWTQNGAGTVNETLYVYHDTTCVAPLAVTFSTGAAVSTYTMTGLTPSYVYSVEVTEWNATLQSPASSCVTFTMVDDNAVYYFHQFHLLNLNPAKVYGVSRAGPVMPVLSNSFNQPTAVFYLGNASAACVSPLLPFYALYLKTDSIARISCVQPLYTFGYFGSTLGGMLENMFNVEAGYDEALFFGTVVNGS